MSESSDLNQANGTAVGSAGRRSGAGLVAVFGVVVLLAGLDLVSDVAGGGDLRHFLLEGGLALAGLGGLGWAGWRFRQTLHQARLLSAQAAELQARLETSQREAERWRAEARDLIQGLGSAIDAQLERWGLSPAEKEVALLLLKGLSHKEIADIRQVEENTVRQQARSLYKKAGLAGRHDLAAFFLEDLLGPRSPPQGGQAG